MPPEEHDGTGQFLTVDAAADVFEGLLSEDSEDTEARETPQESRKVAPESEDAEVTPEQEPAPETDESEAPVEEPNEEVVQPKTRRIKIDGEEVEVTEEELEKGYSRTADYTRKTQELAEKRKALEAEDVAVRGERQQYATTLKRVEDVLTELTGVEPDWAKLQSEDPDSFPLEWATWQQNQKRIEAVAKERKIADDKVLADNQRTFLSVVSAEHERFFEAHPELKDEGKWKVEKAALVEYAKGKGFSPEEIGAVYDHRTLGLLRKAMLYDKAQAAKPKVEQQLKEKTVVMAPGSKPVKSESTELTKSKQRLAKTGSVDDAAEAILHLLD